MFQKRLEKETRDIVRRDLDTFDTKFGSGDAAIQCTTVLCDNQEPSRLSSCTAVWDSCIDKGQGCGQQISMLEAGDTSCNSTAEPVATLSDRFTVPSGSFQFQADWKRLKSRPEEFYMYFKVTAICCFCWFLLLADCFVS